MHLMSSFGGGRGGAGGIEEYVKEAQTQGMTKEEWFPEMGAFHDATEVMSHPSGLPT